MPLLDISHPCSCFSNRLFAFRCSRVSFSSRHDNRLDFSSKHCYGDCSIVRTLKLGRPEIRRGQWVINAIGTLEMMGQTQLINVNGTVIRMENDSASSSTNSDSPSSCGGVSEEMNDREKLRRMRISKANRGNTPWNKGRKHSPETIQRIKERTKLAMRDPKVRMKLVTLGHAQSEETKLKIGVGVRLGWEKRREKLLLQETCLYEWQKLIAGAARKGLLGEDELQWNSFEILSKQMQLEWVESVEQRRRNPRPKGNKRAPKSAEQKRRISEAIAAKWADPDYRSRVCTGLAKYHGIPESHERRPRRKPSVDSQDSNSIRKKKDATAIQKHEIKSQVKTTAPKRRSAPSYKDPLASDKLEMLKNIKAQREAAMDKGNGAVSRARSLIAEAEKAANALEIAANKSPVAYSSLMESRKLIAEAIQVIESIQNGEAVAICDDGFLLPDEGTKHLELHKNVRVNGVQTRPSHEKDIDTDGFGFREFVLTDILNGKNSNLWPNDEGEHLEKQLNGFHSQSMSLEGLNIVNGIESQPAATESLKKIVKKWIRGRLVEVEEA